MKTDCRLNHPLSSFCTAIALKVKKNKLLLLPVCGAVKYRSKNEASDFYLFKQKSGGFAGMLDIVHCDRLMHL